MKPLLGKLPWEWGAPPTVAAGLFGAVGWRIQVLVPRMWEQLRPWIALFTSLLRKLPQTYGHDSFGSAVTNRTTSDSPTVSWL